MKEPSLTNQELLIENSLLRQRIQKLEQADAKRREGEEAVFESNSLLELIVNTIPQSIFWKDSNGRYLGCNTVFASAVGINDPSQIIGKTDFDLSWPRKEAEAYRADDRQVIESGQPKLHIIEPLQQADGTRLLVDTSKILLRDASGRPIGVLGVYEDITEWKNAEETLQASEERYRGLLTHLETGVVVHAADTSVIMNNPRASALLGLSDDQMRGKLANDPEWKFLKENRTPFPIEEYPVNQIVSTRQAIKDIVLGISRPATNDVAWVSVSGFPVLDDIGEISEIVISFMDITERKKAEEVSKQEQALSDAIIEAIPGTFYMLDEIGQYVRWNAYQRDEIVGKPDDQVGSTNALDTIHPDDRELIQSKIVNVLANGVDETIEGRVLLRGGPAFRWLLMTGCRMFIDGRPFLVGIGIDITERKQAEEELRVSEKDLKESQRIAHVGSWHLDVSTNRVVWSEELYRMYGFDPTLPPPPYTEHMKLFTSESWERLSTSLANTSNTGVPYELELNTVRKDGSNGWLWVRGETEADSQGNTVGLWGAAQDITERKRAEVTLANEKERLAVTLRSIGDGVITTDTQCNVVIMNKVAEELTGWKQNEAQGKPITSIFNIINEETRLPCENPAEKVLSTGQIIELANHTLLISRDGTERIIADSGAPIKNQNSVTIGVVLVFRDMTEKQKLLDVIQRTDKLDSLGVLAGGIAHDFNNMLAGIFGYIDLARASTTDKAVSSYLDKSMSVFSRAKDLTQQLLTFSKGGTPQRQVSELGSLIRESAAFALSGSQIGCDYDIDKDLWLANFDKNQIGQVVDNLVINAQQSMPLGGKIVISARNTVLKEGENPLLNPGKYIKLSITDSGIGIPPDLLKRIFDPFFTTKQKGHGLGLTTSYAILRKHDGCIEAESLMGKGSAFHVFLPASNQETVQSASGTSVSHRGSGRILIMDDEPSIREILGISLRGMGYTIFVAKDGEEALRICAEAATKGEPIDCAFFDLTIPGGMGGKETITQIRQCYPDLPVYATSGYSEDPVMAKPAEHGFTDSIRKPYRKEDLVSLLNRHTLENSSQDKCP